MRPHVLASFALALACAAPAAAAPGRAAFRLADRGVVIDAGSMGTFTLDYPLPGATTAKVRAIVEKDVAPTHATLRYEGGGTIDARLDPDGTLHLSVGSMPPDVKLLRTRMVLDFGWNQGGAWRAGDADERPFPAAKPPSPYLFQGNVDRLAFRSGDGRVLAVEFPHAGFAQVQDDRAWHANDYTWMFAMPYDPSTPEYRVKLSVTGEAKSRVLVDAFGQSTAGDFPARVRSADELRADAAAERRWLDSLSLPPRDPYGGLPASGAALGLRKTGFFHVEERGRWFLVDPDGNAFFQLGVCSMQPSDDYTYIAGRRDAFAWLPGPRDTLFRTAFGPRDSTGFSFHLANWIRKTGRPYDLDSFLATNIARCRAWGFNSAGDFSPVFQPAERRANWPYVAQLPVLPWDGIPEIPGVPGAWDPFDDANRRRVEQLFADRVAPHAGDPLLIGYFLANEPIYDALPSVLPSLKGSFACKRQLVKMLQDRYRTIDAFDRAWSAHAKSFDELADRGLEVTTAAARADVQAFVAAFFDAYYGLVSRTFRRFDPNHLLLGSRFQPRTIEQNEALVRACGRYVDVFSVNYYAYAIDPGTLDRLHDWSGGKPMLMSEFYFPSPPDSRLPGGGREVDSQEQRGLAYRNYVEQAAALPYVVGIEWFTLVDMAVTGRYWEKYNGQNFNTGLISVTDRPWRPMLEHMIRTNATIYDVVLGKRAPFVFEDPRFQAPPAKR